ncbi:hypothetical protein [Kitasatospora sp. NPDC056181]|uniref:COG4315 family predicted lipoprotein n=1 Tax=Kitasatospora sp. NPDC056181 TaxID=3345737 RepID=UPI0035D936B8
MRRLLWATMALPAIALGVAACSSGSSTPSSSPASSAPAAVSPGAPSSPPAAAAGSGGTVVAVHTSNLGMILTDNQGRTVYLFEKDSPTMSNCAGTCASAWPPLTTSGAPQPGTGVTASELGTVTRADHSVEVTYHGHPLYYFSGDHNPGDTNGQGSQAFGAGWYVLNPAGNKIDND